MNILKKPYNFIVQTLNELKKVEWLSKKLTVKYTILIVSCLVIGTLFILFVDQIFVQIRSLVI